MTADQFGKITPSEFNYMRERGLCYKCAKPYTLCHVCKQGQIQYILENEQTELVKVTEGVRDEGEEFCDYIEREISNEKIKISIHILAGGSGHKTFKLKGSLEVKEVLILVDSDSTNYFLDERLVTYLQLQVSGAPLIVKVANGERLEFRQLSKPLEWKVHGYEFQHNLNTLKLGSCDMVLGVDWLARYSPIEFDFNKLSMKFRKGKEMVELKGESGEPEAYSYQRKQISVVEEETDVWSYCLPNHGRGRPGRTGRDPNRLGRDLKSVQGCIC